jgi:hypothetical protein
MIKAGKLLFQAGRWQREIASANIPQDMPLIEKAPPVFRVYPELLQFQPVMPKCNTWPSLKCA